MKPLRPIHLEIQTHRLNPVGILRSSFRQAGKVMHSNHGRLTGLNLEQLKLIQAAFAGHALPKGHPDALQILQSREYGASRAVLQLAKELELDRALYSRPEPWVKDVLAMIAGRLIYQGSKLFLSHQGPNTTLWEQCGVQGPVDVQTHCYEPMDRLLQRQVGIQKALASKHLQEGRLVLYDITSSYFEGQYEDSEIVAFGYNRDGKRQHEQMVIGLICNQDGCPVGVEVFAGNTQDASTVPDKIREVQQRYGIKKLIFVGDRGMVTQANYEKVKDWEGLWTISALTHQQILDLLERKLITPELFDERKVVEVIDPDNPKLRYCLCRNPETKAREGATRQRLLELTQSGLEKIARSKRKADAAHIGARVGKLLAKYKMGKFVTWEVKRRKLLWSVDHRESEGRRDLGWLLRGAQRRAQGRAGGGPDGGRLQETRVGGAGVSADQDRAVRSASGLPQAGSAHPQSRVLVYAGLLPAVAHEAAPGSFVRAGRNREASALELCQRVGAAQGHPAGAS